MSQRHLSKREIALLLAGLRLLERCNAERPPTWGLGAAVAPGIGEILAEGGVERLKTDEIDKLCEAINLGTFRRATNREVEDALHRE